MSIEFIKNTSEKRKQQNKNNIRELFRIWNQVEHL